MTDAEDLPAAEAPSLQPAATAAPQPLQNEAPDVPSLPSSSQPPQLAAPEAPVAPADPVAPAAPTLQPAAPSLQFAAPFLQPEASPVQPAAPVVPVAHLASSVLPPPERPVGDCLLATDEESSAVESSEGEGKMVGSGSSSEGSESSDGSSGSEGSSEGSEGSADEQVHNAEEEEPVVGGDASAGHGWGLGTLLGRFKKN